MVARRAHNPKVVGSNPAPATRYKQKKTCPKQVFFAFPFILNYELCRRRCFGLKYAVNYRLIFLDLSTDSGSL